MPFDGSASQPAGGVALWIHIDQQRGMASSGGPGRQINRRGCLSHAPFLVGNANRARHLTSLPHRPRGISLCQLYWFQSPTRLEIEQVARKSSISFRCAMINCGRTKMLMAAMYQEIESSRMPNRYRSTADLRSLPIYIVTLNHPFWLHVKRCLQPADCPVGST